MIRDLNFVFRARDHSKLLTRHLPPVYSSFLRFIPNMPATNSKEMGANLWRHLSKHSYAYFVMTVNTRFCALIIQRMYSRFHWSREWIGTRNVTTINNMTSKLFLSLEYFRLKSLISRLSLRIHSLFEWQLCCAQLFQTRSYCEHVYLYFQLLSLFRLKLTSFRLRIRHPIS